MAAASVFAECRNRNMSSLGYHSVGTHGFPLYCRLPKRVFAEQMRYIKRHYRVLSLRQMMEELQDPKRTGSKCRGYVR